MSVIKILKKENPLLKNHPLNWYVRTGILKAAYSNRLIFVRTYITKFQQVNNL
jgi:hypothetical protein